MENVLLVVLKRVLLGQETVLPLRTKQVINRQGEATRRVLQQDIIIGGEDGDMELVNQTREGAVLFRPNGMQNLEHQVMVSTLPFRPWAVSFIDIKGKPRVGAGLMDRLVWRAGIDEMFNHLGRFGQVGNAAITRRVQH